MSNEMFIVSVLCLSQWIEHAAKDFALSDFPSPEEGMPTAC